MTGDPELDSFIIKIILGKLENLAWCLRNTRNGSKSFSHLVALWLCKNVFTYGAVEFTGYMTYHSTVEMCVDPLGLTVGTDTLSLLASTDGIKPKINRVKM